MCPAYLNATIFHISNQVQIVLMNTHIGHKNENKFLRLPPSLKIEIDRQIKSEISFDKILESIHNSIDESYDRSHLLTKKDIINVQQSFGLKGIEGHSDDAHSVHLMYKNIYI